MTLINNYVVNGGQLPKLFEKIQSGQAPETFTRQHLKDIGLASSNWRASIPLLKALGFLSTDGKPTARYHQYRDKSLAKQVLGEAVREAYGDLFVISENPQKADRVAIEGKFKSAFNTTDNTASLMAGTFYSLLSLADISGAKKAIKSEEEAPPEDEESPKPDENSDDLKKFASPPMDLKYSIEIRLPATKDIDVYNAIFRALRENLVD